MSTSGSHDWTRTAGQIIQRAYRIVTHDQETAPAEAYTNFMEALNAMVKEWQNQAIFLWTTEWKTHNFSAASEVTGTDAKIYTCIRGHTAATGNKPVTGADYTTYWYERGSTGGAWGSSGTYTSINEFTPDDDTVDIIKVFIRYNDTDAPISIIPFDQYFGIDDKFRLGTPLQMAIQKGRDSYKCYLDYHLDRDVYADYVLHYERVRLLEDFDAIGNNPDFPTSAFNALVWNLADEMADEYGVPPDLITRITSRAQYFYKRFKGGVRNRESSSGDFIKPAFSLR